MYLRTLLALFLAAAAVYSPSSDARGRFGFYVGGPMYPYYYDPFYRYYDPFFYAPPQTIITVPATPPTYIQQSPPVANQNPGGYWYYCDNPEGYYPYVKECLNTWQQVEPTPAPTR